MTPSDHGVNCSCCAPTSATQSLDEVAFAKSACSAAQAGNLADLRRLMDRFPESIRSDGSMSGGSGYTPLHYASREGHVECVKLLLESGADPNAMTKAGGSTPLMRAAYMGRLDTVKLLIQHGAITSLQDMDGQTALDKALRNNHKDVASLLLGV